MLTNDKLPVDIVKGIMRILEELNHLKDVDTILDKVLLEARRLTNSDAGSIFLIEKDALKFSYVQNDTLFQRNEVNKHIYSNYSVPIDDTSIVGYTAKSGKILSIEDAYRLPEGTPYSFNRSFDDESGYKTRSLLVIPLTTFRQVTVGVMQLINAKDEKGNSVPYRENDLQYAPLLANHASVAIERGIMTRELILRMVKMAEMRDSSETGAHVQRVGAYTAEIYHQWALNNGVEQFERDRNKDHIRLAGMLHDVGKVGIPDKILKKPGKLNEEEFEVIRWHTIYGAALFANTTSGLDEMCKEIALYHHERWDGKGYPGKMPADLSQVTALRTENVKGLEIPLAARIAALADVFDALMSNRVYKDAWPEEKVLNLIKAERGKHFDPEVVDAFFDIIDVIRAIRIKFSDA